MSGRPLWTAKLPYLALLASSGMAGCSSGSRIGDQVDASDARAPPHTVAVLGESRATKLYPVALYDAGPNTKTDGHESSGVAVGERESDGGDAGTAPDTPAPEPSCVPEAGPDDPDEDFVDSNCDGIDGDLTAAIFVAPSGSDEATGDITAPVQTIAHAIDLAAKAGKSVYVCDAEYDEAITLSHPVSLYAGYACDRAWARERDRATLAPAKGVPFSALLVGAPITVTRFNLRAPDGKDASESSIAATVFASKQVRFARMTFSAGTAANGAAGAAVPDPKWRPPAPGRDAKPLKNASNCQTSSARDYFSGGSDCDQIASGAFGEPTQCPDGTLIVGGYGGDGSNYYRKIDAGSGGDGTPSGGATDGWNGPPGAASQHGFGSILGTAYAPTNDGDDGANGHAGRSGHGGAGATGYFNTTSIPLSYVPGAGGGQGGYGGCGGQGGKHGSGGGASIALLAVDSSISIDSSELLTGRGGDGGDGSDGMPGQPGGPPGKGATAFASISQDGEAAAPGGSGGSGGPGGGGPSIGIVFIGEAPVRSATVSIDVQSAGLGGRAAGGMATDGLKQETFSPAAKAAP
jgi:hypothetical protein